MHKLFQSFLVTKVGSDLYSSNESPIGYQGSLGSRTVKIAEIHDERVHLL